MDRIIHSDTVTALEAMRDACSADLKRLRQTLKGLETKIAQTEAKLEMADQMVETAKTHESATATQSKKPMPNIAAA